MIRKNPKIQFNSLTINNFGPYKGKKIIEFSNDPKHNVILFLGDQGAGKTTIFQLIWWILFPKFKEFEKRDELIFLRTHEIKNAVNKLTIKESKEGDNIKVGGTLELSIYDSSGNRTDYEVSRLINFIKKYDGVYYKNRTIGNSEEIQVYKNSQIIPNYSEFYSNIIEEIFPELVRDFIFIFGEGLTRILSIENVGKIRDYALGISDYPRIVGLIDFLNSCEEYFRKKRSEIHRDNKKLSEIQNEENKLRKNKIEKEQSLKDMIDKLKNLREKRIELNNELTQIQGKKDFVKNYNENKKKIEKLREKRKEIIKKRETCLLDNLPYIYLEESMKLILQDIREKRKKGIIPERISKELIETILKRPESCICGTKWTKEMKKNLNDMIKDSPDSLIDELIIKFESEIESKLRNMKKFKKELIDSQKDLININSELGELEGNQKELKLKLTEDERKEDWYQKLTEIEEQVSNCDRLIGRYEEKIQHIKEELNKLDKEIEEKESTYKKQETESSKHSSETLYSEYLEYIKVLKEIIEDIKLIVSEKIRTRTEIETLNTLKKIARDPENWKKVIITDEETGWITKAITKNNSVIMNISTGQANIVGLSFIFALSNVVGIDLPLIIDSPFINIDLRTREQVIKNLPKIYEGRQLIFFVKDTEFLGPLDHETNTNKNLMPQIEKYLGLKYLISNATNDNAEIRREYIGI
ncbi:MAG: AAA family ATPase [Promethearchaeota archaeon]